ncbi:unnamed protein product [Linum tenue]|uniref:Uncharacterized protein n=1 Tax=Linum tenue TaxID=586396 RepID=A0AAV0M5Y6_9ROSI|nr:unnamed protein product [Linum tenue]
MADFDFGNLSDTDDSAVDELISQTQDLCVLEQVSKINCSGISDSLLPSDLETRFRKLKSFPASSTRPAAATGAVPKYLSNSKSELHRRSGKGFDEGVESPSDEGRVNPSDGKVPKIAAAAAKASSPLNSSSSSADEEGFSENPVPVKDSRKQFKRGSVSSPSDSSNSCIGDVIYSQSEEKGNRMMRKSSNSNSKLKSKPFIGSPLGLSNCSRDSPSPPRKPGCFWCSPKKPTRKKKQEKILRKAMKEEERINKEAEKIVKWAKQAAARMSYHHRTEEDDDGLGDDDDDVTSK